MFLSSAPSARVRCKPLAACIAALCGLSSSNALATGTVWNVSSCADDGPGTLRSYIATPTTLPGDTLSLDNLACSTITLATDGTSITIPQNDLTIRKTGAPITIDGAALKGGETDANDSRIFTHTGTGTLHIQNLVLSGGHVYHLAAPARGGCVRSNGSLDLVDSVVTSCSVTSKAPAADKLSAFGGALDAAHDITLTASTVSASSATSAHYRAYGGGIHAQAVVTLTNSTVSGNSLTALAYGGGGGISSANVIATHSVISANHATADQKSNGGGIAAAAVQLDESSVTANIGKSLSSGAYGGGIYSANLTTHYATVNDNAALGYGGYGAGGAIFSPGDVSLRKSTISNNYSSAAIGGVAALFFSGTNSNQFYMSTSTVSGNVGATIGGGIATNAATTALYNSTIAFNRAADAFAHNQAYAPGLTLNAFLGPMAVTLSSDLLSGNTYAADLEFDLSTANTAAHAITFNAGPANNFIRNFAVATPPASQLPADTLSGSCPLLGPLRDNGGSTPTHALLSGSIGIDHGNDAKGFHQDQRGPESDPIPYPFPRVSNLVPDIGAYEVNQADIVFDGGFDGCAALP